MSLVDIEDRIELNFRETFVLIILFLQRPKQQRDSVNRCGRFQKLEITDFTVRNLDKPKG